MSIESRKLDKHKKVSRLTMTKNNNALRKALMDKIAKLDKKEDLVALNNVVDKFVSSTADSLTPEEVFGDDWTDQYKKLGRIIQGLRFREGLTQIELAKVLRGVKQANISSWESGKEKIPAKRLEQLSKLFKTDLNKHLRT